MKNMQKILLTAAIAMPLLALAENNPCSQSVNSIEAAACNDIYSNLQTAKDAFINNYKYTPPNLPSPPSSSASTPVFNLPPPNSPGSISTASTAPAATPAASKPINIYR